MPHVQSSCALEARAEYRIGQQLAATGSERHSHRHVHTPLMDGNHILPDLGDSVTDIHIVCSK